MQIKFDTRDIKISPRAVIKTLKLPEHPSPELAYFCGLMAGDGHICVRPDRGDYHLVCAGNIKDEKKFYQDVICPLIKKLFDINKLPKGFGSNTYGVRIRCKTLVKYLTDVLGLPKNKKYGQLRIPFWIKSDKELIINYIRGLADTDFCLTLKKRYKSIQYYPVIVGVSKSKQFLKEIVIELEKIGLKVSEDYDYLYKDERLKKGYYLHQRFYIYGHTQLIKWMKTISFSNPKHLNKFYLWKKRNVNSKRAKVIAAIKASKKIEVAKATSR